MRTYASGALQALGEDASSMTDTIVDVATVVIAIVAVAIAVWEGIQSRRHDRLSVKPMLGFITQLLKKEGVGLFLENLGTGPAIVKEVRVKIDGEEGGLGSATELAELAENLDLNEPWVEGHFLSSGSVVPTGERIGILRVVADQVNRARTKRFQQALARIEVVIRYESLYGEPHRAVYEGKTQSG